MLVNEKNFQAVLEDLSKSTKVGLDCETEGLRPWHGDQILGLALVTDHSRYYLVFPAGFSHVGVGESLPDAKSLLRLKHVFENPLKTFYAHNFKFDAAFLYQFGFDIKGTWHCTKSGARVLYNEHTSYSLDACAERDLNQRKDDTVQRYLKDNGLWDWEQIPGKKCRRKNWHYHKVPLDILVPYALRDAELTFRLGCLQEEKINEQSRNSPKGRPHIGDLIKNERSLTKAVFEIERVGLRIDAQYCKRGIEHYNNRRLKAEHQFEQETGRRFIDSAKCFTEVFETDKPRWGKTKKGNPSFSTQHIKKFEHPAANAVLEYRDAKAKSDFLNGFLYWADSKGVIHPTFDPAGTQTGRFSSSEPNFQNLEKDDGEGLSSDEAFPIRRAIIPRDGFCFVLLDYAQQEYRVMLDYAEEMGPITRIKEGLDVHTATAEMVGVKRQAAKTLNFAIFYGAGVEKLSEMLGLKKNEARDLREKYFDALPKVRAFIRGVMNTAASRGFIFGWSGRRWYFPEARLAYRAPNYIVQGTCADVVKIAMNEVARFLAPLKSRIVLQVHDELVLEVHESELKEVPERARKIMEEVYTYKHLPLTVDVEHSWKSLADKVKGCPNG